MLTRVGGKPLALICRRLWAFFILLWQAADSHVVRSPSRPWGCSQVEQPQTVLLQGAFPPCIQDWVFIPAKFLKAPVGPFLFSGGCVVGSVGCYPQFGFICKFDEIALMHPPYHWFRCWTDQVLAIICGDFHGLVAQKKAGLDCRLLVQGWGRQNWCVS